MIWHKKNDKNQLCQEKCIFIITNCEVLKSWICKIVGINGKQMKYWLTFLCDLRKSAWKRWFANISHRRDGKVCILWKSNWAWSSATSYQKSACCRSSFCLAAKFLSPTFASLWEAKQSDTALGFAQSCCELTLSTYFRQFSLRLISTKHLSSKIIQKMFSNKVF